MDAGQHAGRPATLESPASNAFAAALCSDTAARLGVRALVIKGESLRHWELRTDRVSADADLLFADEADVDAVVAALTQHGWYRRPIGTSGAGLIGHSVTISHPRWPTSLDLHYRFPGLPPVAFEALWERRVATRVAARAVWIPDRAGSIVVWALHSLRGAPDEPRHARELEALVGRIIPALTPQQRADLAAGVLVLGADHALREVPAFAALLGDRTADVDPDTTALWRRETERAHAATAWVQILREAPARQRPYLLCRALWPSRLDLTLMDPELVDTPVGRVRSRLRRVGRLARRVRDRRSLDGLSG